MSQLAEDVIQQPVWTTACPDWEERIVGGRTLVPFAPLFPQEAAAALDIFRELRIKDAPGSPTMAQACRSWVFDFAEAIFGAYNAETGRRLINNFLLLVSKKNSKSTTAAGIMLTALIRNWRESGEFYILAPTKEIADNSFFPARDMVALDENLKAILHVQQNTRTITHRNTDAFLKVVAADSETVGGKKTIGVLKDELWLFGKRAGAENMFREIEGGLASRPEGFSIDLSTQSDGPPTGIFAQRLEEFRAIRDGRIRVPESLGVLYEFPKGMIKAKAYENPRNFYIPNPNLGASVDEGFLLREFEKAKRAGQHSVVGFLAKHLNVEIGLALRSDGWAGTVVWGRGLDTTLTLEELLDRSEVVVVGIDGGGLDDLLGLAVIGRERGTGRWLGWATGLISTIGVVRRRANAEDYIRFKRAGELRVFRFGGQDTTEGEQDPALAELLADVPPVNPDPAALPPDIQYVVDLVVKIRDRGLLAQVGVDAAGIGAIVDALASIEVTQDSETLDSVRQGIALMGAIKTLERKLADGSFLHGPNGLLDWCVGNLRVVPTPTAMRVARDEAGYGKVDPAMALFNAAHLMALNPEAAGNSGWDTDDLDALMEKIDAAVLADGGAQDRATVVAGVVGVS